MKKIFIFLFIFLLIEIPSDNLSEIALNSIKEAYSLSFTYIDEMFIIDWDIFKDLFYQLFFYNLENKSFYSKIEIEIDYNQIQISYTYLYQNKIKKFLILEEENEEENYYISFN